MNNFSPLIKNKRQEPARMGDAYKDRSFPDVVAKQLPDHFEDITPIDQESYEAFASMADPSGICYAHFHTMANKFGGTAEGWRSRSRRLQRKGLLYKESWHRMRNRSVIMVPVHLRQRAMRTAKTTKLPWTILRPENQVGLADRIDSYFETCPQPKVSLPENWGFYRPRVLWRDWKFDLFGVRSVKKTRKRYDLDFPPIRQDMEPQVNAGSRGETEVKVERQKINISFPPNPPSTGGRSGKWWKESLEGNRLFDKKRLFTAQKMLEREFGEEKAKLLVLFYQEQKFSEGKWPNFPIAWMRKMEENGHSRWISWLEWKQTKDPIAVLPAVDINEALSRLLATRIGAFVRENRRLRIYSYVHRTCFEVTGDAGKFLVPFDENPKAFKKKMHEIWDTIKAMGTTSGRSPYRENPSVGKEQQDLGRKHTMHKPTRSVPSHSKHDLAFAEDRYQDLCMSSLHSASRYQSHGPSTDENLR